MDINEKIKGAIYGMALGDALGLGTEFMTREEIKSYYPGGLKNFDYFVRDMHRSPYRPGQWTNDTEVILRMLDRIIEQDNLNINGIARKIKEWYDEEPIELVAPYRIVIPSEGWVDNPIVVSHRAWRTNRLLDASNEALNRALIIGILADDDTPLLELTRRLVNMTHDDDRCVATTAVAAEYVRSYFYEEVEPDFDNVWRLCREIDERPLHFIKMARQGRLEDFKIDDEQTWWYSRKSLGVVLWALWNHETAEDLLYTLVNAGGDADTNTSLAMMIAGIKYGYQGLPDLKNRIIGRERLDDIAERFTEYVIRHRNPDFLLK